MITDKDIQKMQKVFATADDHVNVEKKLDNITDKLNGVSEDLNRVSEELSKKPSKDEFPELLRQTLDWVTMKAEHDRMKKILHEKLNVEV
ncbi:hypothetical protein A2W48_01080 [Candidatus Giovannonibacteria bacterium RIFCSPHIGHO2_12_44_12]|uniref:Uncharacterized protein n=2 Tax=Candidatus Giovannoniibacteriota TaxID=1752738 RepID=A0A1F5WYF1_9BACT|nr:MAG: hypothetical protein A2W57_03945 [Candidatus Giovannonibacteria bacterium RIFCSPHIGHO2_02_43_16]OGF80649.1 MAG: hypothetical protein A2W48_01080 [Candidatus Giovannonibacteria bacterium RIFCSPHIGHO2_12_44_12]